MVGIARRIPIKCVLQNLRLLGGCTHALRVNGIEGAKRVADHGWENFLQPAAAKVGAPPRSQREGLYFFPSPLNNFLPVDQMAESVGGGGVDRLFWVGAIYRADPSNRMDRPETPVYKRAHDHPRWHRGARDRDNCPCLRRFGRQRAERGSLMREGLGEYCYRSIF